MGVLTWMLSQTIITSVAVAAMRRNGLIQVDAGKIKNDTGKLVLVSALQLGDNICELGERAWHEVSKNMK